MSILPLPQFEEDLKAYEEEVAAEAAALAAPKTLVVRFGLMGLVGEFKYDGSIKPGCGSKVVVKTHRGTEMTEVLTTTCPNSGCGKSVSRKEMLEYIEHSGGKDYPFFSNGRVLRIATMEDMDRQAALTQAKHGLVRRAKDIASGLRQPVKIVDAEQLLGGERVVYYFLSEERVDTRELHSLLVREHDCRVDLRQVGARDEARLIADYERCGQHCCCKNFLKVLKPISMRSAKTQKATLEPLKISGRCGRLMCCLRYEDETYTELKKRLPHKKTRVGTPHGDGIVLSGQILTQLVLVALDAGEQVAVPVEELGDPGSATAPERPERRDRADRGDRRERRPREDRGRRDRGQERAQDRGPKTEDAVRAEPGEPAEGGPAKKKRRRRRRRKPGSGGEGSPPAQGESGERSDRPSEKPRAAGDGPSAEGPGEGGPKKKRRRRRRRKPRGEGGGPEQGPPAPGGDG